MVQAHPRTDGEKNCLYDFKKIINSLGRENMANSCKLGCCGNSTLHNVCLNLFLKIYFNVQSPDNIHKAYVPKFPYKILYTSEKDRVVIWSAIISSMPSITALEMPTFTSSELMV